MSSQVPPNRSIRSFVLRQGRITAAQKHALEHGWPRYGLDPKTPFQPEIVFGRLAPLIVDIGFGNGDNLAANAQNNPDNNYIGIEVHKPGIGHLMNLLDNRKIDHVRVFHGDAMDILKDTIADESIAGINLFFSDPWPKKRHHKRRLVSPEFAELIVRKLKSGGFFHAATDWADYAIQIIQLLEARRELQNVTNHASSQELIAQRSMTRFEKRGLSLGHPISDIIFQKHANRDSVLHKH
ncbi:MAG: tRNA (guanosine(46)-N7)-methyltransferase TrmB [Methylococcales bacterium]